MNKLFISILAGILIWGGSLRAQDKSLVNTSHSAHAKLSTVNMSDVVWGKGFWGERFQVCRDSMIPQMWKVFNDPNIAHSYRNFEIAAGLKDGEHDGPPFHDGDFYKWLEGVASVYAMTKDPKLDQLMDEIITTIGKCQRADGYIHTPVIIKERKSGKKLEFEDKLNFETYNLGHLMTAGCVHYRATGKTTLLDIAKKATDYLYNFYKHSSDELAKNAVCPSHYMGVIEMYRTTGDPRYLELAKGFINIRSLVKDGTDDNQDRVPFRQQKKVLGHAVRANYLFAGVADIYAETGEDSLMNELNLLWDDVTEHKMYITGACGALYDGTSPDGTSYEPKVVQKVHQSYGRDYQLPNVTAHNESCANIGNMLWNWRMLLLTGQGKYADVMETTLYNSILAGISLNGKKFFYTNPLCVNHDIPFTLRWSKDREEYIKLCNCCPPNTVRTIAEVSNYVYSTSEKGVYVNLYAGSNLSTTLKDGSALKLSQETDYPWDGKINISLQQAPAKAFSIFLRIPGWCDNASLKINGKASKKKLTPGEYVELNGNWAAGDKIELELPMSVKLIESNPMVEETRNQVAVKRGPVVYCIESVDMPQGKRIFDVALSAKNNLKPKRINIAGSEITCLEGDARLYNNPDWNKKLYSELSTESKSTHIRLIPYYAWDNRGASEMSVWMPVVR
ncbi:MAG: glycoside hydrolase family 127 protein [Bacteroidota bacterium]|nr:glycoside hydrolase family 127 protein [Bacteroidota bacterium]